MLERLFITTPIHRPGIVAETVLPSITSPRLSFICLQSEATSNKGHSEFDYPAWAVVVDHLRRLCKRFEARNPGKQMKVGISGDWGLIQPQTSDPPEYPIWKRVFFGLSEEAAVRFLGPILYILVEKSDLRMINLTQWKRLVLIVSTKIPAILTTNFWQYHRSLGAKTRRCWIDRIHSYLPFV